MHKIDTDFIYDSQRLIFYKQSLAADDVSKIETLIPINDLFDSLKERLEAEDPVSSTVRLSALTQAGICLTNGCNLRCTYCGDNITNENLVSLTLDDVAVYLKEIMKRWLLNKLVTRKEEPLEITISGGGEPTYNWNLFQETVLLIEKKCADNHIPLSLRMTTNGILIPYQREFIMNHFSYVMLSYDGMPELQNKNRISSEYPISSNIVEDTIRYFLAHNLDFTVRTTLWQDDCIRLKDIIDYMVSTFGPRIKWTVLPVLPTGRALNRIDRKSDELKNQDFVEYYIEALEYSKEKYGDISIGTPMFSDHLIALFCSGLSCNCACPWLLPNRDIITCIDAPNTKTVIGTINDTGVEIFKKCVDPLLTQSIIKYSECRDCIAYRFCKGGCPAKHLMTVEHETALSNWECSMIEKYWMYVFRKILKGEECFGWKVEPINTIEEISGYGVLKLVRIDGDNDVY
ncbi:MAG: radical SAM protein [Methanocorpusculum sp.]|nr:radical SAM protein [Methanocorpusculum sp.]MBQ4596987.1 radical SAM protein [Methanocorpusculum sp.]